MAKDPDDPWENLKREKEEEYDAKRSGRPIQWLGRKDAEEEQRRVREICHMRCPSCGEELEEHSFDGAIIHVCPACGGVWLESSEAKLLSNPESSDILSRILAEIQKKRD